MNDTGTDRPVSIRGTRNLILSITFGILLVSTAAFSQTGGIRFRLIAVATEADAAVLQDQIARGGAFDELAGLYSIDPSAPSGGLYGPIPAADLRPEYRNALAGLAPGETSATTPIDGAFFIFHLVSAQEERWMEQRRAALEAFDREAYPEAEEFLTAAIREAEEFGMTDLRLAQTVSELASLHNFLNRYEEAVSLFNRVLDIRTAELGSDHAVVGETLNNLAEIHRMRERFGEAEPLYLRSLANLERALGREHPNVGVVLNNLALLYQGQNDHARAQPLFLQSLAIMERAGATDDATLAPRMVNLARAYHAQANFTEARRMYRRALALLEPVLGAGDPTVQEIRRLLNAAVGERSLPVDAGTPIGIPFQ